MITIKGWGRLGVAEMERTNTLIARARTSRPYEGQAHGTNAHGVGLIADQHCANAVHDLDQVLHALGFTSIEELMAAANA